ncbi:MAG: FtsH protease activity modulator HflK [Desulfovibrionales bacterium]|nr:FtsH protease activity modulator HflK [Desulfovibrionales bacterium]
MNWDWEKLQERRQRQSGPIPGPDLGDLNEKVKQFKQMNLPGWRVVVLAALLIWLGSGIYIVEPDELGVVRRFGAYDRTTEPGPHYRLPFPFESVETPKVTKIQRIEVGFRGGSAPTAGTGSSIRLVPEESLMLTGDENIVDVQFIVQYLIDNAQDYLFNVANQEKTVKDAAEAAMREVIGYNKIDAALTDDKLTIQNDARDLLQRILDSYQNGVKVVAVQLQDVHPPKQVIDAFKDVASAKEDKSRFINEAEAYENDLIPKTRGEVAAIVNEAQAYKEAKVRQSQGESSRFVSVLEEYRKARDVTRKRLYLETMEEILSRPEVEKVIISNESMQRVFPYLPLNRSANPSGGGAGREGGKVQ